MFAGMTVFALLGMFIPTMGIEDFALEVTIGAEEADQKEESPRSPDQRRQREKAASDRARVFRTGVLTCLGISLHNIPEGIAVYLTCLKGAKVGLPLGIAMMIHNIPEGIAVACPIYVATQRLPKSPLLKNSDLTLSPVRVLTRLSAQ